MTHSVDPRNQLKTLALLTLMSSLNARAADPPVAHVQTTTEATADNPYWQANKLQELTCEASIPLVASFAERIATQLKKAQCKLTVNDVDQPGPDLSGDIDISPMLAMDSLAGVVTHQTDIRWPHKGKQWFQNVSPSELKLSEYYCQKGESFKTPSLPFKEHFAGQIYLRNWALETPRQLLMKKASYAAKLTDRCPTIRNELLELKKSYLKFCLKLQRFSKFDPETCGVP